MQQTDVADGRQVIDAAQTPNVERSYDPIRIDDVADDAEHRAARRSDAPRGNC
jgi:hypothetical protein